MNVSDYSIKYLAPIVCGDDPSTPYLKGQELITFFMKFKTFIPHNDGFPARWRYTEDCLRKLNGDDRLRLVIEEIVDPRRYIKLSMNEENAVTKINDILGFDNYVLEKKGVFYKVYQINGNLIEPEVAKEINHIFINEQIEKCSKKISEEDYNGAITNARSLIEAIFIEIIERSQNSEHKNDGDVDNLWKKVKKIMKLDLDKEALPDTIFQILSGIDTCVKGLAGLSNNAGIDMLLSLTPKDIMQN